MTQPPDERLTNPGEFVAPPAEAPPYGYSGLPPRTHVPSAAPAWRSYQAPPVPPVNPGALPPGYPVGYASDWVGSGIGMGPRPPLTPLLASMIVLWAAGAVGAVLAPFLPLYGYTFTTTLPSHTTTIDGWGRVSGLGTSVVGHGLIWGIPLVLSAGALLLAFYGVLTQRNARWPAVLGTLATAALMTTTGCIALAWESQSSQRSPGTLQVHTGAGLWVAMLVGLISAVATILSVRAVLDWRPDGSEPSVAE